MNKYTNLNTRVLEIMDAISKPAAPFYEQQVRQAILDVLAPLRSRPDVQITIDRYGNIVARYQHPDARFDASFAVAAHMDHPGYHLESVDGTTARVSIQGGLPRDERLPGSLIDFYRGDYTNHGEIIEFTDDKKNGVIVELDEPWEGEIKHAWGVPDVERFNIDGDLIHGRAMDDLAGCTQQIAALELLVQEQIPVEYTAIFNRAEEVGFIGAVGACELGSIPRHSMVLSLEASKNLEGARPGDGVILRTGDRQSVFDVNVTKCLEKAGAAAVETGYRYQQRLMDGGTCEAALYMAYGYETGALAVPLINYHNQGETSVEAEAIHVHDLAGGVVMLIELAHVLVNDPRVPRSLFLDNRKAWFMHKQKFLLDSYLP